MQSRHYYYSVAVLEQEPLPLATVSQYEWDAYIWPQSASMNGMPTSGHSQLPMTDYVYGIEDTY